jgi:hypothetical protein
VERVLGGGQHALAVHDAAEARVARDLEHEAARALQPVDLRGECDTALARLPGDHAARERAGGGERALRPPGGARGQRQGERRGAGHPGGEELAAVEGHNRKHKVRGRC